MSNATPKSGVVRSITYVVNAVDVEVHVARVKAAWRQHERAMTWEQKIEAIERMRERDAQLARARAIVKSA